MSDRGELNLAPPVLAALEAGGWSATDPALRDVAPAVARGLNLALAWPPAAGYAAPALGGLLSAILDSGRQGLLLVPPHAIPEWAAVIQPLTEAAGLPFVAATTTARATRGLRSGTLRLLLTTPANALALVERSALKTEQLGHLVLGWPEFFREGDEEALVLLMQDLPAETQRLLVLAAPRPGHMLVERYARRAQLSGPLAGGTGGEGLSPLASVTAAFAGWRERGRALAALIEAEDPASLVIWCADPASAALARQALPSGDATVSVVTGDAGRADLVVAWDLPTPARLHQLAAAGRVLLLAPPHAGAYLATLANRVEPYRLVGGVEEARQALARRRSLVEQELKSGLEEELLALAPLFERHDPVRVAGALYRLWQTGTQGRGAETAPAPGAPAAAAGAGEPPVRVWVGVGRKDGAGPNDLVAALTRELGLPASAIGRVEIRELYSLVEVPRGEAERVVRGLSGKTIRRRRVVARLDEGGGRPSGGSRGPSGASPRGRPARPKP